MTKDDAASWLARHFGGHAFQRLQAFDALLSDERQRQNLVSSSTWDQRWVRHYVDSAQLLLFAPADWRLWIDIGTGAGFPGMIVAILSNRPVVMIEPRKLRATFLQRCVQELQLASAQALHASAEGAKTLGPADIISARAVASLNRLLELGSTFASKSTTYILPKGSRAASEIAEAEQSWHGKFHVEHSISDAQSAIVVASRVSRR